MPEARRARGDDLWPGRMAALAQLVRSDVLAVVVPLPRGRILVLAAHGVPLTPEWLHPEAAAVVTRALGERQAAGATVPPIALADGRAATMVLAIPVPKMGPPAGALIALRTAPPFSPLDAGPMARAADLVAAELRSASRMQELERKAVDAEEQARRAEDDRRFALALYELSRKAGDAEVELERALAVCTEVLGMDHAAVLVIDGDGVRVSASRPAHAPEGALPSHEVIDRVRRNGGPTVAHFAPGTAPPWAPDAREAIVAPLDDTRGAMLVLARRTRPFSGAEIDGAALLAAEIGLIVARAPAPAPPTLARPERFAVATTVLVIAQAAILAGAVAYGIGTIPALVLAALLAVVAGSTARGGRGALLLALVLSALAFAEQTSAPLLYGPRDEVAFVLETGGALIALAAIVMSALALRAQRRRAR